MLFLALPVVVKPHCSLCWAGLDSPENGQILFAGKDIAETGLADHRRNHVSFIFQSYNLIDYLTPVENVALTSKLPPLPFWSGWG